VAKSEFDVNRRVGRRISRRIEMVIVFVLCGVILFVPIRRYGGDFGTSLLTVAAMAGVAAVYLVIYRLVVLHGLRKVERAHPGALVFAAATADSLKRAVKGAAAAGRTALGAFPGSFAVVVDSRGIGFWGGSVKPRLTYFTHWVDIVSVVPTEILSGKNQLTGLAIDTRFGDAVTPIEVVVMRSPHGLLGVASFQVLRSLAASVEARRPTAAAALHPQISDATSTATRKVVSSRFDDDRGMT
jgi:hypothetical protein